MEKVVKVKELRFEINRSDKNKDELMKAEKEI